MRVCVTGGAGFIGHHVVDALLREGHEVVSLDRLDCSGNLNRLCEVGVANRPIKIIHHDLKAPINGLLAKQIGAVEWVLHLAAASHVDRSIEDPLSFVMDNVAGTCNALTFAREIGAKFLYFSTDEVFGPAPSGTLYKEWDRYRSGNPYAATKAGGEELALAFANTYKMHVVVTHTMNVIGRRQAVEKYIPSCIRKIRDGEQIIVHADPMCTYPGSRFYIDAREVARAVIFLMKKGQSGDKYNIVGEREVDNLEVAQLIAEIMGKLFDYHLANWHSSRPGHDIRYGLSGEKLSAMGFERRISFDEAMKDVVEWTLANPHWL